MAEFFDERTHADDGKRTAVLRNVEENADPPTRRTIDLPQAEADFFVQPTAVIGVGGLAGRVMRQLRSRLARELGDARRDAIAMLLLDSDPRGISAAVHGNDQRLCGPKRRQRCRCDDRRSIARLSAVDVLVKPSSGSQIPKSLCTGKVCVL